MQPAEDPTTVTIKEVDLMTDSIVSVSNAEREVLMVLWELERATVREIRQLLEERGLRWAHTTISTLLTRLEEKQLVCRDATGFAHVYSPAVSREAMVQQRLRSLADDFCDGASAPLVLALVEGERFTKSELEEFRQLIDQLEQQTDKRSSRRRSSGRKRE